MRSRFLVFAAVLSFASACSDAPSPLDPNGMATRLIAPPNGVLDQAIYDLVALYPTGTETGVSPLPDLTAEFNFLPHVRGTVSAARAAEDNSANSQFFIMFLPRLSLDRYYTAFGRVISGMDGVDAIERGEPPTNPTTIVQASIAADGKPQKLPDPVAAPSPAVPETITPLDLGNPLSNSR